MGAGCRSREHERALGLGQRSPGSGWELAQFNSTDAHADQAQGGMSNGSGHAPHLAVLALDQLQAEPAGGDGFAEADGWLSGWDLWLRVQNPGAARQGFAALNHQAFLEASEGIGCRNSFDLRPVLALVSVQWVQEPLVQVRL